MRFELYHTSCSMRGASKSTIEVVELAINSGGSQQVNGVCLYPSDVVTLEIILSQEMLLNENQKIPGSHPA